MSSSDSSQPLPFKSKKPLHSRNNVQDLETNPDPLTSKTPEKQPAALPRRTRNSTAALSIKEVRRIAQSRPQQHRTDQIQSARKQILSWPSVESSEKADAPGSSELPEKYKQLRECFYSLDSAIRLLKLKRSVSTFTNICPKIQSLTERRFTYGHLAQLKFILPEAIEIKKTLVFDERSSCMKPDLHITINVDAIEYEGKLKSESKNIAMRKVFQARLINFLKHHPKGDDIPEEILPEPFNVTKPNMQSNTIKMSSSSSSTESVADSPTNQPQALSTTCHKDTHLNVIKSPVETSVSASNKQQPVVASHFSRTFVRRFSQKLTSNEAEKNSSLEEISSSPAESPVKLSSKTAIDGKNMLHCDSPVCLPVNQTLETPIKKTDPVKNIDDSSIEDANLQSTPAKLASTPARLMATTPAMNPPKRCYMSPEDDSVNSSNKLVRRPPRSRSLKFDTPVKNSEKAMNEMEGVSNDDDILDILPENLLQSIREKERKVMEERDPAISQAKRRKQMIACLPKLFNMIRFLFQSINRSVITKEELLYKIISSHFDIVDRREIEEQINLLLELVPDWISEKLASGGDLLVRVNKISSPESIRARLEEAN